MDSREPDTGRVSRSHKQGGGRQAGHTLLDQYASGQRDRPASWQPQISPDADGLMHHTRVTDWSRRDWPPATRTMAVIIAAIGVVLLVAACGGGSHSSSASANAGTSVNAEAVAFSRCMRSHGVSNFPDPDRSGVWPKTQVQLTVSNPRFQAATQACGHLLPDGGPGVAPSPPVVQKIQSDMLKFARCMRSNGATNWPDPTLDQGRAIFDPQAAGIDPNAQQISTKMHVCEHVFPQSLGRPPGT